MMKSNLKEVSAHVTTFDHSAFIAITSKEFHWIGGNITRAKAIKAQPISTHDIEDDFSNTKIFVAGLSKNINES